MSERAETVQAILIMEDDVYSVLRYATALSHLACSPHMIEPECLSAFSNPLEQIGKRLREQFQQAHASAAGRS